MPLLVDGYNLLHVVEKITELGITTRGGMLRLIEVLAAKQHDHAHVVFDGTAPKGWEPSASQWVDAEFSGPSRSADDVVRDRIQANTAPRRLTVVSTDHELRRAATRRDAVSVTSEDFAQLLTAVAAEAGKPRRPPLEPPEKRRGLSPAEGDAWLRFFGIDPDALPPRNSEEK